MAETITVTVTDSDETITVTIDEAARGPAGPAGGVESYVDEIESLPDYPASFPPASHTHVSADITNASEGGNGADDAGKLVKFAGGGSLFASQVSAYIEDLGGPALIADSLNGTSLVVYATNADLFAQFAGTGNNNAFVARVDGAFGWVRGVYTSRIKAASTLTGNHTATLPDASGTVALTSDLDAKANLAGTNTFTGANIFSSTTRPTSAGTGTPAATSLMTRDDVTRDEFLALGISFKSLAAPSFATSGTGTSALAVAGDRWVTLASGTSNSGWARATIARGLTTNTSASGSGINFSKRIGVAVVGFIGRISFADGLNIFRLIVGSNQTPAASGADPVTYRSFGLEMRASGTAHEIRAFGHNGTSITYSLWVDTGLTADILSLRSRLAVESDGAGNITASIIHNHSTRAEVTATCTGGPTTAGASAQSYIDLQVANSSSGTTSLGAAFYDHLFYVI